MNMKLMYVAIMHEDSHIFAYFRTCNFIFVTISSLCVNSTVSQMVHHYFYWVNIF